MKDVELFRGDAILAAVNELRYTGRRIADALIIATNPDLSDEEALARIEEHLIIAESYLTNADHDLTDAVVLYVLLQMGRVVKFHGARKIEKHLPDYQIYATTLEEAQELVRLSRQDRTRRTEIYGRLADFYAPRLMQFQRRVDEIPKLKVPDGEVRRGLQILSIIVGLGAIANIAGFCLALWVRYHTPDVGDIVSKAMQEQMKPRIDPSFTGISE